VIAGRQFCADWYASQSIHQDSDLAKQNAAHTHFIEILQKIWNLLNSTVKPSSTKRAQDNAKITSDVESMGNLFACWEIEEPSEPPLASAPDTGALPPSTGHRPEKQVRQDRSSKRARKHRIKSHSEAKSKSGFEGVEFQLLDDEDGGIAFALWCLLQDLNDVRNCIQASWLEYGKGDVSLLAADVITETAFGLMRRATDSFVAVYPRFAGEHCMHTNCSRTFRALTL